MNSLMAICIIVPLILGLLLTSCGNFVPTKKNYGGQLAVPVPSHWEESAAYLASTSKLTNQLLKLVNSPKLTMLVEQTLADNYDLRQTALRLREQRLLAQQTYAGRKPELNLNLNFQRNKNEVISNSHNLSMDLSWELDVWGRLASASSAAEAQTQAQALDYQAARNSLAARVIQHWISISMREQIINTEVEWLNSLENTEDVITERYKDGLDQLADLETARAATARIRASLSVKRQNQRDAYRQLAMLQGKTAGAKLPQPKSVLEIKNPPLFLPAEVIANRPDLQAAYKQIVASNAEAAVAYKRLLPGFNFSASFSDSRLHLRDLLSGSIVWSLLGRLTAPLYNAGRLKAGADIAELAAERSYLAYQQTLLNALNELEGALGQEATLAQQQLHFQQALRHSETSFSHYQARYHGGLSDILDFLNAKQSVFEARIQLLEIKQARMTNRITLGLALGMGV